MDSDTLGVLTDLTGRGAIRQLDVLSVLNEELALTEDRNEVCTRIETL